jgi:hypothetical protein
MAGLDDGSIGNDGEPFLERCQPHREIERYGLTEQQHEAVAGERCETRPIDADAVSPGRKSERAEPAVGAGLDRAGDTGLGIGDGGHRRGKDGARLVPDQALEIGARQSRLSEDGRGGDHDGAADCGRSEVAPVEDSPALQHQLGHQQRHRPAEPAGDPKLLAWCANVGGIEDAPQRAEGDEGERHDVAANHPVLVLRYQPATNRGDGHRCRRDPGNAQSRDPGAG